MKQKKWKRRVEVLISYKVLCQHYQIEMQLFVLDVKFEFIHETSRRLKIAVPLCIQD